LQPDAVPVHGECAPFLRLRIALLHAGKQTGSSLDGFLHCEKVIFDVPHDAPAFLELRARECSYCFSIS
jgi:hypothetical protein